MVPVTGVELIYASTRCIYLLWIHPASKFPGPKLAKVSNVWYAYHWMTGKYPWKVEAMMKQYGDIVRIAPNELVFMTPQAITDIYGSAVKNHETFLKTSFMDLGTGDGGITWEQDPIKHRITAKKVSPAFSSKSIKAKESVLHLYIDMFVRRMRELGNIGTGVDLNTVSSSLPFMTMIDVILREGKLKTSDFLEAILGTNFFGTVNQISKKFPLLTPLMLLFIPPRILRTLPRVIKINKHEIQRRIDERNSTEHLDYFETLIPANSVLVTGKERTHLEQIAGQLLVAGYDPISNQFYGSMFQLLKNPEVLKMLTTEIRCSFHSYDEIAPDALLQLNYLQACLLESFRIFDTLPSGLPRISPGASVDGIYIEKGVHCQTSFFTTLRSDRYFHDPLEYHPQRWLAPEHPKYEHRFSQDNLKSMFPFLLGPRMCPGRESAWIQLRLFLAKVLWTFDLELVKGQDLLFDRDFSVFTMWDKPEMRVRFIPASGREGFSSNMVPPIFSYFKSHLFFKLPYPTQTFSGLTIIITGANSGLGLEAARHLVRLNASKVILAVRNLEKGAAAKSSIIASTNKPQDVIDVWKLDLTSRDSVKAFAARAQSLERLDVVIENAGVLTHDFVIAEDNELTITVNVVNTFLLALLVLPKLRDTSTRLKKEVVLVFTGSLVHWLASFPERNSPSILEALADKEKANMNQRYVLSKLIELLAYRELSYAIAQSNKAGNIVASMVNPGSVQTALDREGHGIRGLTWSTYVGIVGRTAEEGSRTLVHAATGGRDTHGQYLDDCQVGRVSDFVNSQEGLEAQRKLWKELTGKLEEMHEGITQNI
ncbi:hypothetical protein E0Z10_g2471 [Xylaria hypoxylon]|uniref:Uncharacterized protein n=1 Tax=Xylaria hypoxylon TaxID=37992 RepID=A0A4Z0YPN6_9PEZI|nr:hypothetical protein E0Z10_g2471 [Xylaria hypoxylon]